MTVTYNTPPLKLLTLKQVNTSNIAQYTIILLQLPADLQLMF